MRDEQVKIFRMLGGNEIIGKFVKGPLDQITLRSPLFFQVRQEQNGNMVLMFGDLAPFAKKNDNSFSVSLNPALVEFDYTPDTEIEAKYREAIAQKESSLVLPPTNKIITPA